MRSLGFVLLVLAACGGSSKPAPQNAAAGGGGGGGDHPCVRGADHLIDLMSAEAKDAPPEKIKHFKDSFVTRCETDKWSAQMQSCVIDAKAPGDLEKCDSFLTPEQKDALSKESGEEDGAAPPPPPPPPAVAPPAAQPSSVMPAKSRGPTGKKKAGDPCEGGE
jgi:hypothetical protein